MNDSEKGGKFSSLALGCQRAAGPGCCWLLLYGRLCQIFGCVCRLMSMCSGGLLPTQATWVYILF